MKQERFVLVGLSSLVGVLLATIPSVAAVGLGPLERFARGLFDGQLLNELWAAKAVLALLVFLVLLLATSPLFKQRQGIGIMIALIVAIISLIGMPDTIVRMVYGELSAVVGILLLLLPAGALLYLNKIVKGWIGEGRGANLVTGVLSLLILFFLSVAQTALKAVKSGPFVSFGSFSLGFSLVITLAQVAVVLIGLRSIANFMANREHDIRYGSNEERRAIRNAGGDLTTLDQEIKSEEDLARKAPHTTEGQEETEETGIVKDAVSTQLHVAAAAGEEEEISAAAEILATKEQEQEKTNIETENYLDNLDAWFGNLKPEDLTGDTDHEHVIRYVDALQKVLGRLVQQERVSHEYIGQAIPAIEKSLSVLKEILERAQIVTRKAAKRVSKLSKLQRKDIDKVQEKIGAVERSLREARKLSQKTKDQSQVASLGVENARLEQGKKEIEGFLKTRLEPLEEALKEALKAINQQLGQLVKFENDVSKNNRDRMNRYQKELNKTVEVMVKAYQDAQGPFEEAKARSPELAIPLISKNAEIIYTSLQDLANKTKDFFEKTLLDLLHRGNDFITLFKNVEQALLYLDEGIKQIEEANIRFNKALDALLRGSGAATPEGLKEALAVEGLIQAEELSEKVMDTLKSEDNMFATKVLSQVSAHAQNAEKIMQDHVAFLGRAAEKLAQDREKTRVSLNKALEAVTQARKKGMDAVAKELKGAEKSAAGAVSSLEKAT